MKRTLLVLLFVQLFICCRNEKKKTDKNESVKGSWSFLISNGYNCYVCPKIQFGDTGNGNLILSSKRNVKFIYELLPDNRIRIDFDGKESQTLFKQSEVFYYENQTKDDSEYFDLIDLKEREIIHSLIRKVTVE